MTLHARLRHRWGASSGLRATTCMEIRTTTLLAELPSQGPAVRLLRKSRPNVVSGYQGGALAQSPQQAAVPGHEPSELPSGKNPLLEAFASRAERSQALTTACSLAQQANKQRP